MAKKGLCFENAIAPAPRTLFSMVQNFTGRHIMFTEVNKTKGLTELINARRHIKSYNTIAEILKKRKYFTGAFCPNAYTSRYFGFDKGFDYFQDFMFCSSFYQKIFSKMVKNQSKIGAILRNIRNFIFKQEVFKTWESYYDDIINWVGKAKEPFFLWIFLLDTHLPWIVPRSYRSNVNIFEMYYYNFKLVKLLEKKEYSINSTEFIKKLILLYNSSIRYSDDFIKNIIRDLDSYDPVFIIHSDHGEEFGERGHFGHFHPHLYEENIHVPLIVYNSDERSRIHRPFSLINLPAVISGLTADSLIDTIENILEKVTYIISKDYNYLENRTVVSARLNSWKYITGQNSVDELYNLEDDPNERINLINDCPEIAEYLRKLVKSQLDQENKLRKIRRIYSKVGRSL